MKLEIFREERIKELQGWLKELPSNEIERRSCGSNMLDDEITKEIEEIVDNFPTKTPKKTLTMQIKPGFIYRVSLKICFCDDNVSVIYN